MRKKIKTYMATAPLDGFFYPQKAQSSVMRAYCLDHEIEFTLPITEQLGFVDILTYQVLNESLDALVFFSVLQLKDAGLHATTLLKDHLNRGLELHFALESIHITSLKDFEDLELGVKLSEVSKKNTSKVSSLKKYNGIHTDFITKNHLKSKRNYQERATDDKARLASIAKKFDFDYWDGERDTGYGGYRDDGRWSSVAEKMINHYELSPSSRILDIGCGKGYLLKEFKRILPQSEVWGIDISSYAIENSAPEVSDHIILGNATELPFVDNSFDLVVSNMTLHNLSLPKLKQALIEMNRVSREKAWLGVESYTTEEQKWNLMRWQLTCECFFTPEEWVSIFEDTRYCGDYELIYFD